MGGCLISEFMPDEKPLPNNFPRRNRIISGLSKVIAVIEASKRSGSLITCNRIISGLSKVIAVIEASKRSGSLITCRFALEQNREIFAVPAFPGGRNSATNSLLRDGAKFLETSLDIISELQYDLKIELNEDENNNDSIIIEDKQCKEIYHVLTVEPLSLNGICMKLNIDVVTAMSSLASLELDGIIEKSVDDKYVIIK